MNYGPGGPGYVPKQGSQKNGDGQAGGETHVEPTSNPEPVKGEYGVSEATNFAFTTERRYVEYHDLSRSIHIG